jgi:CheY-like chemotaxis protein
MLVKRIVEQLGDVELLSAHTAEIEIVMVCAERPDLVLIDINRPGMSGIDAMRVLRESKDMASIPIVAIRAAAMQHDLQRASGEGFEY